MNRKDFLKLSCSACVGVVGASVFLSGCGGVHYVEGIFDDSRLRLAKSDFTVIKGTATEYRKYVVTGSANLDYPIVVFRTSDSDYAALLLRCTHQGTELNVHGDLLVCPAHGSEFNNRGQVVHGPADQDLKSFAATTDERYVYVRL